MELSLEEKKAIKYLEFLSNEKCECEACQRAKKEYKTILNLIEKQQKEIKELKEKNTQKYYHNIKCRELEKEINRAWKDKIREKIKELEKIGFKTIATGEKINILKELLEEE